MSDSRPEVPSQKQPYWLIYFSFVLAGVLLLSDAYRFAHLAKWTAKLGIALLYSAVSLFIGKGRAAGYVAAMVIWLAVLVTFLT
ncbi:MAG: hypothetical protein ACE5K8_02445 [Candidatus Zixiibacteriota bacterium]